eukprot:COSAG06_NODE_1927_length_8051_cov_7.015342_6_plen_48_part_00
MYMLSHGLEVEGVGVVKNVAREDDEAVVPVGDHLPAARLFRGNMDLI